MLCHGGQEGAERGGKTFPPPQALHVCIELNVEIKELPPQGKVDNFAFVLSSCCSVKLRKEKVLWDVAASPEGGGTALRWTFMFLFILLSHQQTPSAKMLLFSREFLRKGLPLLCTYAGLGGLQLEEGRTWDASQVYRSTKCILTWGYVCSTVL